MEIIERLKLLDLSIATDTEILSLFDLYPNLDIDTLKIPPGIVMYRYRKNKVTPNGMPILFKDVEDISYRKDIENISKYGRCNIKGQSMFYGTLALEDNDELQRKIQGEVQTLALFETMDVSIPPIINNTLKIEYYTVGQWISQKEIQVLMIHQHEDFHDKAPFMKRFYEKYVSKLNAIYSPKSAEEFLLINKFFASEYAKYVDREDYKYKISANYINEMLKGAKSIGKKLDGIIYPSAKSEGMGYNIALTPDVIQLGKLKYRVASTDKVFIYNANVIPNPIYVSKESTNTKFNWLEASIIEQVPSDSAVIAELIRRDRLRIK